MVETKILLVVSYYYPYNSGVTEYVKRLAEGLAQRRHDVTVLTSQHNSGLPKLEVLNGVKVKRLPVLFKLSKGVFKPTLLPTLRKISKDFDVVNIHVPLPEVGLCTLLSRSRNIILTYHCDLELRHSLIEKIIERVYYLSLSLAMPRTRKIIVNDMDYALSSRIRKYKSKLIEIHPPIPQYERKDPTLFLKKYGINEGEKVVGFLGRLVYEKGIEYLLKAVPIVLEKQPNTRFIIAGEGEDIAGGKKHSVKENLMKMSSPYNNRIIFTGFLPKEQVEEFYSACDVFVLPSIASLESFGMVQAEAMLCGTPVIATDRPGVRTPVSKTRMGLIIPPKDEKALAEAIIKILENTSFFKKPRDLVEKIFNTDNTLSSYEKLFKEF